MGWKSYPGRRSYDYWVNDPPGTYRIHKKRKYDWEGVARVIPQIITKLDDQYPGFCRQVNVSGVIEILADQYGFAFLIVKPEKRKIGYRLQIAAMIESFGYEVQHGADGTTLLREYDRHGNVVYDMSDAESMRYESTEIHEDC